VQLANQLTQMDARQSATIENLQITASNQWAITNQYSDLVVLYTLLYHYDRKFSHTSQRPVNWTLEGMCHASQGFVNVMLNESQKSVKIKNLSVFLMLFGTTDRRSNKLGIQEPAPKNSGVNMWVNTWIVCHASHGPVNLAPSVHKSSRVTPRELMVEMVQ
jgi:hypothetical protein